MKTGGENWTGNEDSVRKNKLIIDCLSNIFLFEKWGIICVVKEIPEVSRDLMLYSKGTTEKQYIVVIRYLAS